MACRQTGSSGFAYSHQSRAREGAGPPAYAGRLCFVDEIATRCTQCNGVSSK